MVGSSPSGVHHYLLGVQTQKQKERWYSGSLLKWLHLEILNKKSSGRKRREEKLGQGKREGERSLFKSPNSVVATVTGESLCSGPRTDLEN